MPSKYPVQIDKKKFVSSWSQDIDVYSETYGKNQKSNIVLEIDGGYNEDGHESPISAVFTDLGKARSLAIHILVLCDKLELEEKVRKDTISAKRKKKRQEIKNRE